MDRAVDRGNRRQRRDRRRPGVAVTAALATMLAALAVVAPAQASIPAPAVEEKPITNSPTTVRTRVVGARPSGNVFVLVDGGGIAIQHPDGSAQFTNEYVTSAAVGSDGRAWGSVPHCQGCDVPDGLAAVTEGGVISRYPVPMGPGQVTPKLVAVTAGIGGRIWFLDAANHQVGSMATDGSDLQRWAAGAVGSQSGLVPGPDGRMWFGRTDKTLAAVDASGAVTTVTTLNGVPLTAMATFDGVLWVVADDNLRRIGADGSSTLIKAVRDVAGMAVANGRLWLLRWRPPGVASDLMGIDHAGRIRTVPIPQSFTVPSSLLQAPFGQLPNVASVLRSVASIVPSADGTGLIATTNGTMWRLAAPVPGPTVTARTVSPAVKRDGHWVISVSVSAYSSEGGAVGGSVDVVVWGTTITGKCYSEGPYLSSYAVTRRRVATVALDRAGRGTGQVSIVPSMLPKPWYACGGGAFGVAAELHRSDGRQGASSTIVPIRIPPFQDGLDMGRPMTQVSDIYDLFLSAPADLSGAYRVDDGGARYWADRVAAGTSRSTVAKAVVASSGWRKGRVALAYWLWLRRTPDKGGLDYWSGWLADHTAAELDLAIGSTAAARDAQGTTSAARGDHLADALNQPGRSAEFTAALKAGKSWSRLLSEVYFDSGSLTARAGRIRAAASGAAGTGEQPGTTISEADVRASLVRTRDEREADVLVGGHLLCGTADDRVGRSCDPW